MAHARKMRPPAPKMPRSPINKVERVMREFKSGALHSGSKSGPPVTNRKQAVAIGMSEQRKAS